MPYINGIDLSYLTNKRYPHIQKIGISSDDYENWINGFLITGCKTFLSKGCNHNELFKVIEVVANNQFYYNEYVTKKFVKTIEETQAKFTFPKELSEVQYFFILLCQTELTYIAIADILMLKEDTLDKVRHKLFEKFDVKNRTELVAYAFENRIIKARKQAA